MKNTNKSKRITKDHDTVNAFVYKKYRGHPLPLECPSTSNNSSYQSTSLIKQLSVLRSVKCNKNCSFILNDSKNFTEIILFENRKLI